MMSVAEAINKLHEPTKKPTKGTQPETVEWKADNCAEKATKYPSGVFQLNGILEQETQQNEQYSELNEDKVNQHTSPERANKMIHLPNQQWNNWQKKKSTAAALMRGRWFLLEPDEQILRVFQFLHSVRCTWALKWDYAILFEEIWTRNCFCYHRTLKSSSNNVWTIKQ